jgi:FtsZ-interacting cell division protein ZipA
MSSDARWSEVEIIKMINIEILEGLKVALSKGESLKQAMTSFYNAGYKKEDIEETAQTLYQSQQPTTPLAQQKPVTAEQPVQTAKPVQPVQQVKPDKTIQKVSNYEQKSIKYKAKIIILITILIILFGALIGVFLFKNELVNFFGTLY